MAENDGDTVVVEKEEEGTIDIDALSDKVSAGLFPESVKEPEKETVEEAPATEEKPAATPSAKGPVADAKVTPVATPEAPTTSAAPKSWPKEMHAHWDKVPKEVQDYWTKREQQMLDGLEQYKGDASWGKTYREVLSPYLPHIKAANIQPEQMVSNLLNAHWQLTMGSPESRKAAYERLGRDLGFAQTDPNAPVPDPKVQALEQQLMEIRSGLTAQQQAQQQQARAVVQSEVDTFASDTAAHPYFDEVADDIVALLQAYPKITLQDAYDRAVYANPVTRQKEIAKVETSAQQKLRENARLDALPKKKAASVNVRSRDTERAPTEPLGTMEDTIRGLVRARTGSTH